MEENDFPSENQKKPAPKKKTVQLVILIAVLAAMFVVVPFNIYSYLEYKKKEEAEKALIEKNKKEAEERKIVEEKKKKEAAAKAAELKKKQAEEAKKKAELKKKAAEDAKRLAEEKKKAAEEAKQAAEEAKRRAEAEKKQAELKLQLVYEKQRDDLKAEIEQAKDFVTTSKITIEMADGTIYKEAQVTSITPKGIDITWPSGAKFLRYKDLAGSVKKKIGYSAIQKLAALEKAEAKRREEVKKAEEEAKKKEEAEEKARKAAEKKKAEEAKKKAEEAKKAAPAPAAKTPAAPAPAAPAPAAK